MPPQFQVDFSTPEKTIETCLNTIIVSTHSLMDNNFGKPDEYTNIVLDIQNEAYELMNCRYISFDDIRYLKDRLDDFWQYRVDDLSIEKYVTMNSGLQLIGDCVQNIIRSHK
jgi:hypothetical protein